MFRELHFPTPIYIADIVHPTLNQELERDIVAWSNKDKGLTRTNLKGVPPNHITKEFLCPLITGVTLCLINDAKNTA